jgi:hypothetical protein
MTRATHRYPLLIYEHMLNRWWPATLTLGLVLVGLWWLASRHPIGREEPWRGYGLLVIGGIVLLFTFFLVIIRKAACVQLFNNHLRLMTPFLRLNISYQRIRHTSIVEMNVLFPPAKLSGWMREAMTPMMSKTAVLIDLNGYPVPVFFLRLFLSPFFFKDKTPHLVILVNDWMSLSTTIDIQHVNGELPQQKIMGDSILSRLPRAGS